MNSQTLTDLQTAFSHSGCQHAEAFLEQAVSVQTIRNIRASLTVLECGEQLESISGRLARVEPHPYVQAGAPYGHLSPWQVRRSVEQRLSMAQATLERSRPGFRILVFDAFRPLAVQAFMIEHECHRLARELKQQAFELLKTHDQADICAKVMEFWATPNDDPTAPPPHTTGAAVDVTLMDDQGQPIDMGTDIDDLTEKAYPSYFQDLDAEIHTNRTLLNDVMQQSGFHRNPVEWWHFSYGDQAWALIETLEKRKIPCPAHYGAVQCISITED